MTEVFSIENLSIPNIANIVFPPQPHTSSAELQSTFLDRWLYLFFCCYIIIYCKLCGLNHIFSVDKTFRNDTAGMSAQGLPELKSNCQPGLQFSSGRTVLFQLSGCWQNSVSCENWGSSFPAGCCQGNVLRGCLEVLASWSPQALHNMDVRFLLGQPECGLFWLIFLDQRKKTLLFFFFLKDLCD